MAKLSTRAVQAGKNSLNKPRAVTAPIYLSTTYTRNEDGSYDDGFIYSRAGNPNRETLETALADLEGGEVAYAFGSGMAAMVALIQTLAPGDEVIIPDDAYFALTKLMNDVYSRWGIITQRIDMTDIERVEEAINENTRHIWVESPSNPQLKITDIAALAELAKAHDTLLAVDNTWPTPVLQNPIALGADAVIHSSSKYLGGHSDVLSGGLVLAKKGELSERIQHIQELTGGVPSPFDCWLICRGLQTLPVRVREQSGSAMKLATWFEDHPKIERVLYPGLTSHPGYEVAKKQMHSGAGGMLSILLKENVNKILEISHQLRYFTTATSLGGVESLIEHRKSIEGDHSSTPENLLRISVGLEDVDDLIADWSRVLK